MKLSECVNIVIASYGGLRELARVSKVDPGYLSRLRSGEKVSPSKEVLDSLGIERVEAYRIATLTPPADQDKPADCSGDPTSTEPCESCDAKQAKIDALMLEYCPDEMAPEQVAKWAKHQRAVNVGFSHLLNVPKEAKLESVTEAVKQSLAAEQEPVAMDDPTPDRIAEIARNWQRGFMCPLCGKDVPHDHTPEQIIIYRNGVKWGRTNGTEQWPGANHSSAQKDERDESAAVSREGRPVTDQHHEHRVRKPDIDGNDHQRDSGGDGVQGEDKLCKARGLNQGPDAEQEPHSYMIIAPDGYTHHSMSNNPWEVDERLKQLYKCTPLYTAPPKSQAAEPRAEPVQVPDDLLARIDRAIPCIGNGIDDVLRECRRIIAALVETKK